MRLVILVYHLSTFNKKKEGLCGCTTAVFVLRRKKLGCQKTLQNFLKICLFSLQNFAFWMQNLRLFFAKNRGDRLVQDPKQTLAFSFNLYSLFLLPNNPLNCHLQRERQMRKTLRLKRARPVTKKKRRLSRSHALYTAQTPSSCGTWPVPSPSRRWKQ